MAKEKPQSSTAGGSSGPKDPTGLGRATYRAQQVPGAVVIFAEGWHPTSGYTVFFQQSPLDIYPPQFILREIPPTGMVTQVLTPFAIWVMFGASETIDKVIVHDADGAHEIDVEQTPDIAVPKSRETWVYGNVVAHGAGGQGFVTAESTFARPTTMATGEEGTGGPTTMATGEEDITAPTTLATGEEGPGGPTTLATGEEEGRIATTLAVGEEEPNALTLTPRTTWRVGEEEAPTTWLRGEENPTTFMLGEENPTTLRIGEEGMTTLIRGEEDPTTLMIGEENPPTTLRLGEEEPPTTWWQGEETPTTLMLGEEDPTTRRLGEEGPTTEAVGEEGPPPTTLMVGEEIMTTLAVGEEESGGTPGGGNPFGGF